MTHPFCDHCPGCRPALLDLSTGKPLPSDSPQMHKVNQIWNHDTTYLQRKAYIEVTVHNSRDPVTLGLAAAVFGKIRQALESPEH